MSSEPPWADADAYITGLFSLVDADVRSGLERSAREGLPEIEVSAPVGRLLELLVRLKRARRVLEIGTLGGFSTTFLARGVGSDGRVVTLEIDDRHADVARRNLADAGVGDRVEVLVGDAHQSLARLAREGADPFDAIFLDAEKAGYPAYLDAVLALASPGALLVADNVIWGGEVLDPDSDDPDARGLRAFNERVAEHPRIRATILQTGSGSDGWDGLLIGLVE